MPSTIKISVIIPVYNVELYLENCLDSLLKQGFQDWQAICINDGSGDSSWDILQAYAKKDSRFLIINQENQGVSATRNNALDIATGDYIFYLDADDFIHSQALEITYNLATKNDADLVMYKFDKIRSNTDKENALKIAPLKDLSKIAFKLAKKPLNFLRAIGSFRFKIMIWTKLYKRSLIADMRFLPDTIFEDNSYTIELLLKNPKTIMLDMVLYHYTINPVSLTKKPISLKYIQDCKKVLEYIEKQVAPLPKKEQDIVVKHMFPRVLGQQFKRLSKLSQAEHSELWDAFIAELRHWDAKGFIRFGGNNLKYFKYKKLIKKGHL